MHSSVGPDLQVVGIKYSIGLNVVTLFTSAEENAQWKNIIQNKQDRIVNSNWS